MIRTVVTLVAGMVVLDSSLRTLTYVLEAAGVIGIALTLLHLATMPPSSSRPSQATPDDAGSSSPT